jgi:hypothetical protein
LTDVPAVSLIHRFVHQRSLGWGLLTSALFHGLLFWGAVEHGGDAVRADREEFPVLQAHLLESPKLFVTADPDGAARLPAVGEPLKRVDSLARQKTSEDGAGKPVAARNSDFDTYWARPYLSVAPSERTDVIVERPRLGGISPVVLHLTLYIDETGKVRRVRNDTPGIQREYVDAATRAFSVAEFRPGEIGGQAVRSLLQMDVTFDSGSRKEPRPE